MKKAITTSLFLVLVLSSIQTLAQKNKLYNRKTKSVFPQSLQYEMSGWFFSPGLSYTLTKPGKTTLHVLEDEYQFKSKGKLGFYLEGGRYKIFEYDYFFKYIDYGLGYKSFAGAEQYSGPTGTGKPKFHDHHASAFFNFNKITDIRGGFLQNSIGLNVDYKLAKKREIGLNIDEVFPSSALNIGLHYKFGIGTLITKKLMIIPTLELPLLEFVEAVPKPFFKYWHSDYYPILLSIKFILLKNKSNACPPVLNPAQPNNFIDSGGGFENQ